MNENNTEVNETFYDVPEEVRKGLLVDMSADTASAGYEDEMQLFSNNDFIKVALNEEYPPRWQVQGVVLEMQRGWELLEAGSAPAPTDAERIALMHVDDKHSCEIERVPLRDMTRGYLEAERDTGRFYQEPLEMRHLRQLFRDSVAAAPHFMRAYDTPVRIGNWLPPRDPRVIERLLHGWLDLFARVLSVIDDRRDMTARRALTLATMLHFDYESIHPSIDGNGRMGRLLFRAFLTRASEFMADARGEDDPETRTARWVAALPLSEGLTWDLNGYYASFPAIRGAVRGNEEGAAPREKVHQRAAEMARYIEGVIGRLAAKYLGERGKEIDG